MQTQHVVILPTLAELPTELVHVICSFAGPCVTLLMMRVCRRFCRILNDEPGRPLWQSFVDRLPADVEVCLRGPEEGGAWATGQEPSPVCNRVYNVVCLKICDPRRLVLRYLRVLIGHMRDDLADRTHLGNSSIFSRSLAGHLHELLRYRDPWDIDGRYIFLGGTKIGHRGDPPYSFGRVTSTYAAVASVVLAGAYGRSADGYSGREGRLWRGATSLECWVTPPNCEEEPTLRHRRRQQEFCTRVLSRIDSNSLLSSRVCLSRLFPLLEEERLSFSSLPLPHFKDGCLGDLGCRSRHK